MKLLLLPLTLFALLFPHKTYFEFSQLAVYNYSYKAYTTSDSAKTVKALLFLSEGSSIYMAANHMEQRDMKTQTTVSLAELVAKGEDFNLDLLSYKLIKDYASNKNTLHQQINGSVHTATADQLEWHISNEAAEMNGYSCQKATTSYGGRNFTAWFTTEVAVKDGPYVFAGLPGLVVQVADEAEEHVWNLNSLQQVEQALYVKKPAKEMASVEKLLLEKKDELMMTRDKFLSTKYSITASHSEDEKMAQEILSKMHNRFQLVPYLNPVEKVWE